MSLLARAGPDPSTGFIGSTTVDHTGQVRLVGAVIVLWLSYAIVAWSRAVRSIESMRMRMPNGLPGRAVLADAISASDPGQHGMARTNLAFRRT